MSIYRRDHVLPEWEPIPWDMRGKAADAQERGFHARATKEIEWTRVPVLDFPAEGVLGHDRDWFRSREVDFYAVQDGEELILWDNVWFGFPDPPRWGLASRAGAGEEWVSWGHFPDLPACWSVPGEGAARS
ncbi:hypothetical protein P6144_18120 [Sphingomonas sp. HITSZ_GF]|uniref:hypothetical protein n=1 Tax=Sphingomonas sp. HITSZ_GF TaxID=3037247 RepID=UPI00240D534C|nr:hypothetical protein [Sphingomonas sp. HITSZ_GF]MDG2535583.1 hypothetical protein [Sphingomonas sp. HITSZ_GF]